jgi:hypothetical protein
MRLLDESGDDWSKSESQSSRVLTVPWNALFLHLLRVDGMAYNQCGVLAALPVACCRWHPTNDKDMLRSARLYTVENPDKDMSSVKCRGVSDALCCISSASETYRHLFSVSWKRAA